MNWLFPPVPSPYVIGPQWFSSRLALLPTGRIFPFEHKLEALGAVHWFIRIAPVHIGWWGETPIPSKDSGHRKLPLWSQVIEHKVYDHGWGGRIYNPTCTSIIGSASSFSSILCRLLFLPWSLITFL
jgi:hypothetical protein